MNQVNQLKQQGFENFGSNIIKNSCNFQSKAQRFQNRELRDKAALPGPGHYDQDLSKPLGQNMVLSLSKKQQKQQSVLGPGVMNPPSIPSHLSVFGYEENANG